MVPISVLDTQSPGELPLLVPALEAAGFYRYWASEHYSPLQSASPLLIAGLAAGLTERMRVGTAGVLLRCSSALRVAADAVTLEMFFPGRIDIGIAGAFPGGDYTAAIACDVEIADDRAFADRAHRVKAYLAGDRRLPLVGPCVDTRPSLWICGTSMRSAELAGRLHANFAFHRYLAPASIRARDVAEAYRARFYEVASEDKPLFAVAAYGACATSSQDPYSQWLEYWRDARATPSFIGGPRDCAAQLQELVRECEADELVVDCFCGNTDTRVDALTALAEAWRAVQP